MIANKEDLVNTETKKKSDEKSHRIYQRIRWIIIIYSSSKTGKGLDEFLVKKMKSILIFYYCSIKL